MLLCFPPFQPNRKKLVCYIPIVHILCLIHIGYMLLYETTLTMSSDNAKFGEKKIKFDLNTKNRGSSNGVSLTGKAGLKSAKKNQNISKPLSTRAELGSPWGVLLKPVPHLSSAKSPKPEEKLEVKFVPKVSFNNGPHEVEEHNIKKSELKKVNVIKTKKEVRLIKVFSSHNAYRQVC